MRGERHSDAVLALAARRQQLKMRLAMGAGMAVALGALGGWITSAAWFGVWLSVQIGEVVLVGKLLRRSGSPAPGGVALGLGLIFLNNSIFGLMPLIALRTNDP